MARVAVTDQCLKDIADAIRVKNGLTTKYKPNEMADAIENLPSSATVLKRGVVRPDAELVKTYTFDKYLHENKPIQYLIGTSCFYGYDFIVNENVLIPRFETEELVENILYKYDEHFGGKKVEVCDLATGSGCIAITLAKEEPNMHVVATDISKEALEVAKRNNEKFDANVKFLQGDMLTPLKGKKFDIFVSNPPYITNKVFSKRPASSSSVINSSIALSA